MPLHPAYFTFPITTPGSLKSAKLVWEDPNTAHLLHLEHFLAPRWSACYYPSLIVNSFALLPSTYLPLLSLVEPFAP